MDYLFHAAFENAGTICGRRALSQWVRARFADDSTVRDVLGVEYPTKLRILLRRVNWCTPMIPV
jgi:hypothetical protein